MGNFLTFKTPLKVKIQLIESGDLHFGVARELFATHFLEPGEAGNKYGNKTGCLGMQKRHNIYTPGSSYLFEMQKTCTVCGRSQNMMCKRYGAQACSACATFFIRHREHPQKLICSHHDMCLASKCNSPFF